MCYDTDITRKGVELLLDKLIEKQRELQMTDKEFSTEISISRPLWTSTRNHTMPIRDKTIRGVLKRFPDLKEDVLIFLREDVRMLTEAVRKTDAVA